MAFITADNTQRNTNFCLVMTDVKAQIQRQCSSGFQTVGPNSCQLANFVNTMIFVIISDALLLKPESDVFYSLLNFMEH